MCHDLLKVSKPQILSFTEHLFYFQEQHSEKCILTKNASALTSTANQISLAFITFDLKKKWYVAQIYYFYYFYYYYYYTELINITLKNLSTLGHFDL